MTCGHFRVTAVRRRATWWCSTFPLTSRPERFEFHTYHQAPARSLLMYRHSRRSARPQLEALEDRQLLNATLQVNGGVLNIQGTNQADHIQLNDNGRRVSVFTEGTLAGSFTNLNAIHVNTQGGNDKVSYNVQGT